MGSIWAVVMFMLTCVLQGPNYCWHMDGYDKLSAFGFGLLTVQATFPIIYSKCYLVLKHECHSLYHALEEEDSTDEDYNALEEEDFPSRGRLLMPYMYVTMLFWRRRTWTWVHGGEAGNEARLGKR